MKPDNFQRYKQYFSTKKLDLLEQTEKAKQNNATISLLVANGRGVMARLALVFSRRGVSILSIHTSTTLDQRFSNVLIRTADVERETLKHVVKSMINLIDVIDATLWDDTPSKKEDICFLKIFVNNNDKPTICGILAASTQAQIVDFSDNYISIKVNKEHPEYQTLFQILSLYGEVIELR
ncbi:ACT domain-containing protein, partial [Bacteriovoracaceae bacterium]|nr:ACT domain-containing protein [Bacteriovoracaceae bacterium]